jgi:hypothetical protein
MPSRARTWRRLGIFATPYLIIGSLLFLSLQYTGEFLPVRYVAWLQSKGVPFLYLPATSDHNFRLKVEAAKAIRPEVLVIGPSRANQFRSAMFKPMSFYNAGNSVYVLRDYQRMLEEMGAPLPRVVVFSLDFYFFNDEWDAGRGGYVSYDDVGAWGSAEHRTMLSQYVKFVKRNPLLLLPFRTDPYSGVPALGFQAAQRGKGFRIDGSIQYGDVLRGDFANAGVNPVAVDVRRVERGRRPFLFGDRLDTERLQDLSRLAEFARSHNVTLVGVTMPYAPEMVTAMDNSPRHEIWRQFLLPQTAQWFRSLGIVYFDFTRLESFGGRADEFVDGFHASETAILRMLLAMTRNPEFAGLLPRLERGELERKLQNATALEAYKNDF